MIPAGWPLLKLFVLAISFSWEVWCWVSTGMALGGPERIPL